uniref:GRIP domain-containing protein n=1 Tax=Trichuris muris TaxID=70415 RepID=A0A5S6PYJ3_TRIMR
MFQGLKSRLAEETRKLQNAVNQVGSSLPEKLGNLSQGALPIASFQDKQAARSNEARAGEALPSSSSGAAQENQNLVVISLETDSDSPKGDFVSPLVAAPPMRQRHDSGSSVSSYDSIFMQSYTPVAGNVLLSDLESIADEDSVSVCSTRLSESSSLEKVSMMLDRLSSRASVYRDKYKKALGAYKNCLTENERLKATIDVTRDRAIERIRQLRQRRINETEDFQKIINELNAKVAAVERAGNEEAAKHKQKVNVLEDLLGRCKESITNYKSSIELLTKENNALREKVACQEQGIEGEGVTQFAANEVEQRWQEELKHAEENYRRKVEEMEEQHNMSLARIKQEVHEAIEQKDAELVSFHQRLNLALDELESTKVLVKESKACEETLENEKKELISQLAAVKQAVVKAIVDEEGKKREALKADYEERLRQMAGQVDLRSEEIKADYDRMYKLKQAELDQGLLEERQQMMLEVEEREMQKSAALLAKDEMIAELNVELEKFRTSIAELESRLENYSQLDAQREELERRSAQHNEALLAKDETIGHHQEQIERLRTTVSSLEDRLAGMNVLENERKMLEENLNNQRVAMDDLTNSNADLEARLGSRTAQLEELRREVQESERQSSQLLFAKEQEMIRLREQVDALQTTLSKLESEQETRKAELQKATEERDEAARSARSLEERFNELNQSKELTEEESSRKVSDALLAAKQKAEKDLHDTVERLRQSNQSKLNELHELVEKWKTEATVLQNSLDAQTVVLIERSNQLEQSKMEKRSVDEQMDQLQAELEGEKEKVASFEGKLEKVESERARIAVQLTSAEEEIEGLRLEKERLEESRANYEALQKASSSEVGVNTEEDLESTEQLKLKVKAAATLLGCFIQGHLSLLDKSACCIPALDELMEDADSHTDRDLLENVGNTSELAHTLRACQQQLANLSDDFAMGEKSLDEVLNESAFVNESVNLLNNSVDLLLKVCRSRKVNFKKQRDRAEILFREKERLESELDTLRPIRASCERICSNANASLSGLKRLVQESACSASPFKEGGIVGRVEQVEADCDRASVTYDLCATFDDLISTVEWMIEVGEQMSASHQASLENLEKRCRSTEAQLEELEREKERILNLRLSEQKTKMLYQKEAVAFFADVEGTFDQLSSEICQRNIPVLAASLECLDGLVSVCSRLKCLDDPFTNREEFLNALRSVYMAMLSGLESEVAMLNEELSNSKERVRTIDDLKARLASRDAQAEMRHTALQRVFDAVAVDFDKILGRLGESESAVDGVRSSLIQLAAALERTRNFSAELTSLRTRVQNLEAEGIAKQKELDLLRRTSVWSDWEEGELAAVDGNSTSPSRPRSLETEAHATQGAQRTDQSRSDQMKELAVPKIEVPLMECDQVQQKSSTGNSLDYNLKNSHSGIGGHDELSGRQRPTDEDHQPAARSDQTGYLDQERKRFDSVDFHPLFAEPTEAEYLKNILYRYMTERESLGRESVTLAKAIAAVVKFSPSQTRLVLLKEESRSGISW